MAAKHPGCKISFLLNILSEISWLQNIPGCRTSLVVKHPGSKTSLAAEHPWLQNILAAWLQNIPVAKYPGCKLVQNIILAAKHHGCKVSWLQNILAAKCPVAKQPGCKMSFLQSILAAKCLCCNIYWLQNMAAKYPRSKMSCCKIS